MNSGHLLDRDLAAILRQLPSVETNGETLEATRAAVGAWRLDAPAAPTVCVEEHRIPSETGQSIRVLVYRPADREPQGGLLWIHGGGMVMGTPDMNDLPNRHLAELANCVVVAVQYRLAPEHPYPAGLNDCYAALAWMHRQATELGYPAEKIAVAGESGGGALAAGLALLSRDRGEFPLSAQFLMFPMLDDRTGSANEVESMPFAGEHVWTRASNAYCWSAVLGKIERDDVPLYASPARAGSLVGLPPTYIAVGDLDLFVGEDMRFARDLVRDGVPAELHIYAGAPHGFTAWGASTPVARRCQGQFWDAIARHFEAGSP